MSMVTIHHCTWQHTMVTSPVVQYLLGQGADKEARGGYGCTPLHLAAIDGHLPVVLYLCVHGADTEERDVYGMTPLHYAEDNGNLSVVQYFEELK